VLINSSLTTAKKSELTTRFHIYLLFVIPDHGRDTLVCVSQNLLELFQLDPVN